MFMRYLGDGIGHLIQSGWQGNNDADINGLPDDSANMEAAKGSVEVADDLMDVVIDDPEVDIPLGNGLEDGDEEGMASDDESDDDAESDGGEEEMEEEEEDEDGADGDGGEEDDSDSDNELFDDEGFLDI
jgi:hypothetical protein